MKVQTQERGAVTVIRPDGPLVAADVDEFKEKLGEEIRRNLGRVVLDVSAVPFVDSRALECLVDITGELAQSGKALKLCAPADTLKEVLELTGVASDFEHFDDVIAAVRSFL
ncbi:MAG: STAS domain-containing protein [Planctomycetota bacterium]|jgi:anti-anti-sigma factor